MMADDPQMFAVYPKTDCPHIESCFHPDLSFYDQFLEESTPSKKGPVGIKAVCGACDERSENWICLHCGRVFCSRYRNEHMLFHHLENPDHAVCLSFSDLSFWCYPCESYVVNKGLLDGMRMKFEMLKFGELESDGRKNWRGLGQDEQQLIVSEFQGRAKNNAGNNSTNDNQQGGSSGSAGGASSSSAGPQQASSSAEVGDSTSLLTLEDVAEKFKKGSYKNVCVIAGAGISVSAGIPDFRSPKTGVYDTIKPFLKEYGIDTNTVPAEIIFSLDFFEKRPEVYTKFCASFPEFGDMNRYNPTLTHRFLQKYVDARGILDYVITQNIDGLEKKAGIRPDRVIPIHGEAVSDTVYCSKKHKKPYKEFDDNLKAEKPTFCDECGLPMKPPIVFFGESLDAEQLLAAMETLRKADLVFVLGTSLNVAPVSALPHLINQQGLADVVVCNLTELELFSGGQEREDGTFAPSNFTMPNKNKCLCFGETTDAALQRLANLIDGGSLLNS